MTWSITRFLEIEHFDLNLRYLSFNQKWGKNWSLHLSTSARCIQFWAFSFLSSEALTGLQRPCPWPRRSLAVGTREPKGTIQVSAASCWRGECVLVAGVDRRRSEISWFDSYQRSTILKAITLQVRRVGLADSSGPCRVRSARWAQAYKKWQKSK